MQITTRGIRTIAAIAPPPSPSSEPPALAANIASAPVTVDVVVLVLDAVVGEELVEETEVDDELVDNVDEEVEVDDVLVVVTSSMEGLETL